MIFNFDFEIIISYIISILTSRRLCSDFTQHWSLERLIGACTVRFYT